MALTGTVTIAHNLFVSKKAASSFASVFLSLIFLCSCDSIRSTKTNLQTTLHTRDPNSHRLFDASNIDKAIQEFGNNREAAFVVLKAASNETNMLVNAGRTIDINNFVRAGAIYGMGQLGKSVPEVTPFLWKVIYSPSRKTIDRSMAFDSLKKIGFKPQDIPALADLISSPVCENILTLKVPETISELIETNPPAATPYLSSVEKLLDDPNPDTQFRAALALVKSEGASNPKIFSALHALFQRPNNSLNGYYKSLAAQILGEAGSPAKPLVPDLLGFAKLPDEDYVYQFVAKIAPELSSQIPEVAQALKEQKREEMWAEKWKSNSYTLDDLRSALKEPGQELIAAKHLAEMGTPAKIAVPDMIRALWGEDEGTRNEILADIYKIDPQVTVAKIDVNQGQVSVALQFAYSVLEKMPTTPQDKTLTDSCFQMFFMGGWVLPEELAALTNNLAMQAPAAYNEFLEGLKPQVCRRPVQQTSGVSGSH